MADSVSVPLRSELQRELLYTRWAQPDPDEAERRREFRAINTIKVLRGCGCLSRSRSPSVG